MQKKNKKLLLSGIQPSGRLHIGNYFGAMKQFVDMQDEYENYIFLANYHALTTIQDRQKLEDEIRNLTLDYLAVGLDPKKVLLYRQSSIPEVTELAWILSCLITVPYLSRAHAFKDKTAKGIEASVGLFNYPVLMAADILIMDSDIVPVGKDQEQHVEMARDIAQKFNKTFGETFTLPKVLIKQEVATVPGIDGQKMSKSYGNTIPLFGTEQEIKKAVMSIVTDSKGVDEPKDPETCNVFAIHKLVTSEKELQEISDKYKNGDIGYGESKEILLKNLLEYFAPMKERREYYENNPKEVEKILKEAEKVVQKRAQEKIKAVRKKVGLV